LFRKIAKSPSPKRTMTTYIEQAIQSRKTVTPKAENNKFRTRSLENSSLFKVVGMFNR
jgi:hypothetical protein